MRRLLPLLLVLFLGPLPAAAQKPAEDKPAAKGTITPEMQEVIQREVQKALEKADKAREEKAQEQVLAKDDFVNIPPMEETHKLNLLQISGYLRTRGDLLNDLSLKRGPDTLGYYLFPPPYSNASASTQTSANMRLRLEPTLNVSDQIRVLTQLDLFDNLLLGANPEKDQPVHPVALAGNQTPPPDSLRVKRAWGEVQTPVGLLSFGRMPSQWGLGILSHAGGGLDDDRGDNVDRLQLAVPLRQGFMGFNAVVAHYDVISAGLASQGQNGSGQPFDLDRADDATTIGLKLLRLDTDEELKTKLDRGDSSLNYGAWYSFRTQSYEMAPGATDPAPGTPQPTTPLLVKRGATAHVLDLWGRWRTKRLRLELEATGIFGTIQDAREKLTDAALGRVLLRQFGFVLQGDYRFLEGRLLLGGELGLASGDSTPGMGNHPERGTALPGSIDGSQIGADSSIRNFRFNPAYRVDLILWRELLGNVTDAWYLKPTVRYELLDGLSMRLAAIYSQAINAASTPSTTARALGLEFDAGLHYVSGDGFHLWLDWGVLQPLDGFTYEPNRDPNLPSHSLARAHALRSGFAIRF